MQPSELTVKVQKPELIGALRENRERHQKIFEEAVEGYKKKAEEILAQNLEAIKQGKMTRAININMPQPVNHIRDYDRIIKMLEMHQGEVIEIPETDFQQYVMDDWSWRREFYTTNAVYSASARALTSDGDGDAY